ncbi:MAG TPA: SRPBCC family protein [Jatrophihabitans sp.]|nr:SRPBCC family protein [Jatrophihabitans sp.]
MNTQEKITVNAAADTVWTVFSDVQRWPSWTPSVTSVEPLDGPALEVGHRFRIKQPWLPSLVWEVTAVDAPHGWTWTVRSFGATTSASHSIEPRTGGSCAVTQVIEQHGVLGVAAGALTRRLTRRYLSLEGRGLKSESESVARVAARP